MIKRLAERPNWMNQGLKDIFRSNLGGTLVAEPGPEAGPFLTGEGDGDTDELAEIPHSGLAVA
jgi:hypothetical protein